MTAKPAGIRDVASLAGVSPTTVSHVLNETPHTRVSEETADRVRSAAAELDYRPNRLARGLRTQASDMVGLLTEEIAATPHAGRIILGAQQEATRRNLTLAIINSELREDPAISPEPVQAFLDRHVDGVIYATVYHDEIVAPANLRTRPAVLIGARDADGNIPAVLPDETAGAASVVKMLIARGHRRIGFAASAEDVPATRGRLIGYETTMADSGLGSLTEYGDPDARGGYAATLRLIDSGATAVFCYNDRMAIGAYRAAAERSRSIPEQLSIVGFDDQAPIPDSLYPALTTVTLPHYEMGAWAVETLAGLIDGHGEHSLMASHPTVLPCTLAERDSVAPPHASAG
ncbi:LacI family DNA-binding transcriptional regulator [uncultured Microbacterium sp.]|uniref:LacI family DNA-binding transcriptional regulator n=1 Tax=uncultured Microbacterium sp. TaxID=191216 RepID=UPI00260D06AD|nr:LacI family DNA-binding transcriptional regulator [uncultured Microbacterium sp.]